jgi:hypothetical protein
MRRTMLLLTIGLLAVGLSASAALAQQPNFAKVKEYRIERSVPPEAQACIECHRVTTPGVFADWAKSRHANANITCHGLPPGSARRSGHRPGPRKVLQPVRSCPGGKPSTRCRSLPS